MRRVVGRCGPRHRSVQTRSPVFASRLSYMVRPPAPTSVGLLGPSAARLQPDQLELEPLVRELGPRVVVGDRPAGEPLAGLDDLEHLLLDGREVLGGERPVGQEVVVEAVLDRRPDAEQGAREQVLDGLGHRVRGRVAHDREAVGRLRRHRLDLGRRASGVQVEVLERAVGVADHDGAVRAGQLDPGLAQRVQRRRARGDPDGLDGLGRTGAGGQQDLLGAVGRADRSPWMLMR